MSRVLLAFVSLLAMTRVASAHQTSIKYLDVDVEGATVDVVVRTSPSDVSEALGLDADAMPTLAQALAAPGPVGAAIQQWLSIRDGQTLCPAAAATVTPASDVRFLAVAWRATCPAPVSTVVVDLAGFFAISREHQAVVNLVTPEAVSYQTIASAGQPTIAIPIHGPRPTTAWAWIRTGMDHIYGGRDHISFVLALLLVVGLTRTGTGSGPGWSRRTLGASLRATAKIITAFTIAHSITLIIASLGWVTLPGRAVESVIAISIAYTAVENIIRPDVRWRFILTFGFGLVHGLGFASVLSELLPADRVVVPLLEFNLGVELGQLSIVAVALPLILGLTSLIGADRYRRVAMPIASSAIAGLGVIWVIERILDVTLLGL